MPLAPGTRLGPYRIASMLGAGGMGESTGLTILVWAATSQSKLLPAVWVSDADRRERFEREARAVAALNHPNIIAVHDVGTDAVARSRCVPESRRNRRRIDRFFPVRLIHGFSRSLSVGRLRKLDVGAGSVLDICAFPGETGTGGTWNDDDTILFASFPSDGLYQVPANGGTPRLVTRIDRAARESAHAFPRFVPGSRQFL